MPARRIRTVAAAGIGGILAVAFVSGGWAVFQHGVPDENDQHYAVRTHVAVWATAAAGLVALTALAVVAGSAALLNRASGRQRAAEAESAAGRRIDATRAQQLGALAAGLAHELGQPLSAARVDLEGLHYLRQLGRPPDAAHVERVLQRVGSCVLSMTQTVEHLRELATEPAERGHAALDLGAAVAALLAERAQWLRHAEAAIAYDPPAEACIADADPAGLRLVLVNLLRNAVEAVSAQDPARRVVRIAVGPGPRVAVLDSGPGIPPERLARIFDPFASTKGGARGVGLSLAYASAQRMGAQLEASSDLGVGSVFTVRLKPASP